MEEKQRKSSKFSPPKGGTDKVIGLDLSFQGLKCISSSILLLITIKELSLNNNELESIPKDLFKLKNLEKLNLSHNKLRNIPPELGKAVSLRELHLNDNLISSVPMELGTLYNLDVLNLSNNPLISPFNSLCKDKALIHFCRENNVSYPQPNDRAWIDTIFRKEGLTEPMTVGTFNILCNFYAAKCVYAQSWVINPELRKENVISIITAYNVDILALQEIETHSYSEFYKVQLEQKLDYDGAFLPRGRAQALPDKRTVDGCAIFWKKSKFKLLEQINLDFFQKLITDPRFSTNQDMLNRNMRKDNVSLITVLERNDGIELIVVNTHIFWDPDYADVKLLQIILVIEEIETIKKKYKNASLILMGDFNSLRDSPVYKLLIEQQIDGCGFGLYDYSPFNDGFKHNIKFMDAYNGQDLTFTNFTPVFKGVIDYIFYSDELVLTGVLSPIEEEYTEKCVGLPNIHFPSDHIFIGARYSVKYNLKSIEPQK
ncbi:Glucose-repressible alcohol dehydrogenase transcriptional effector [Glugoides intestinalis]